MPRGTDTFTSDQRQALVAYLRRGAVPRSGRLSDQATPAPKRFILFATPLIQAILAGRKTVTRRLVKQGPTGAACPMGVAGDRLWVREKWGYHGQFYDRHAEPVAPYVYAADGPPRGAKFLPWKPSLHMPRAACRLVLRITESRRERLTRITPEDAAAEGCPADRLGDPVDWFRELWDGYYAARGCGWRDDPELWVIRFDVLPGTDAR